MQVSTIVNDVARELGDTSMVTWTRATLIGLLNKAQRQVVLVRPDANSVAENFALVAGTKQDLPLDAIRLIDVTRNTGADGLTPGKVINFVDSETLDAFDPDWHSATQKAVIEAYCYDESVPRVFYVSPPSNATTQIEIKISKETTDLDPAMDDTVFNDAATVTGLNDIYANTLMEWMLYKAKSHETSSAASQADAKTHMQSFYSSLNVKLQSDAMNSPEVSKNGSA